jgi:LysM repeat protein
MEIRDPNTGQIKTWVWAVVALVTVVLVFVVTKVMGGGQSTTTASQTAAGQSSDITAQIAAMEAELQQLLQNQSGTGTPPPPPPPPPGPKTKNYTIKHGETLTEIADKFGIKLAHLITLNPVLKNVDVNKVLGGGRVIQIPLNKTAGTPTPEKYTVKAGDTWTSIANQFHITVQQFYALNPTLAHTPNQTRSGGRAVIVGTSYVH